MQAELINQFDGTTVVYFVSRLCFYYLILINRGGCLFCQLFNLMIYKLLLTLQHHKQPPPPPQQATLCFQSSGTNNTRPTPRSCQSSGGMGSRNGSACTSSS